jgi:hypothetical protein
MARRARLAAALAAATTLAAVAAQGAPNPLQLTVGADCSYSVSGGSTWSNLALVSAPTGVMVGGTWHASGGGLALQRPPVAFAGRDAWGDYNATLCSWTLGSNTTMLTIFRAYLEVPALAFEQVFPAGVAATGGPETNSSGSVAAFPAWQLPAASASTPLAFMQWAGPFLNNGVLGPNFGSFKVGQPFSTGLQGGPIVLFDATGADAVVMSASSEFMAANWVVNGAALSAGPLGSAQSLPPYYSMSHVMWYGAGINVACMTWGAALLDLYGKPHGLSTVDFTSTHLIYNTDHGAYYYYSTANYPNYSVALSAVYNYSLEAGIPYRGVLLDSWWYFKGIGTQRCACLPLSSLGGGCSMATLAKLTWLASIRPTPH